MEPPCCYSIRISEVVQPLQFAVIRNDGKLSTQKIMSKKACENDNCQKVPLGSRIAGLIFRESLGSVAKGALFAILNLSENSALCSQWYKIKGTFVCVQNKRFFRFWES